MEPASQQADSAPDKRILWVEGYRDNREFLAVFLGMAGYVVTSCDSISQAATVVQDRPFDIYIVGDCKPYGSSLPLAAQIKAVNPEAPLILYSALAFAKDIELGLKAGAHAYITKPGNLDYLLATITGLLKKENPLLSGSGGKADRLSCGCATDQAPDGAPGTREVQPNASARPRSTILVTRPVARLRAFGSVPG
jgi:DNA-binding response OmpR family regulator